MRHFIVSLLAGVLFAVGLGLGGMTDANNVIAFLDLAGDWDYRLALVMGGGLLVTVPAYALYRKRNRPLLGGTCTVPSGGQVDKKLLLGGAIFGLGWGLGGFCPGPAVVSSVTGDPAVLWFLASMSGGMVGHDRLSAALARRARQRSPLSDEILPPLETQRDEECIQAGGGAPA